MSDEKEPLREFDEVTGIETDDSAEKSEKQALEEALVECQAVADMAATPGWQWLKKMLLSRIDAYTQDLLQCTKLDEMYTLQKSIMAHKDLLALVDDKISLTHELLEKLKIP